MSGQLVAISLAGKVALVTGAGQGLGRAIAQALAWAGATVGVNDIVPEVAQDTAAELTAEGRRALAAPGDVSQEEVIAAIRDRLVSELGPVDILINNAGICPRGRTWEISPEEWDRVMEVNLRSAFLCVRAFVPGMMERSWGRIVNVASAAGKMGGLKVGSHYAASKGGLLAFTKSLTRELTSSGVTANCVCPALIGTGMSAAFSAEERAEIVQTIPLGRVATTQEVAAAIVFLASDAASYITGEMLDVSGGLVLD